MSTQKSSTTQRIFNLVPSIGTEEDWSFDTGLAAGALTALPLPASVDLRQPWWKIGDQGQTGSCVGWATGEGVMRYLLVKAGRITTTQKVSPRYVWMASKEFDQFIARPETFIEQAGTSLKAAADICRKYGVALEVELPFLLSTTMYLGNENAFYANAAQRKAASYFNAGKDLNQWKTALANDKPVLVGLNVDASWMNAPATGIIDNFQPNTIFGGHAVCLVGYRADGRFIVRNSWNTTWGDKGFAYVSPQYIQDAFFNESYVMNV